MTTIQLHIPFIPPSINRLYFNNKYSGGRTLSKEGDVFKIRVKDYIVQNYLEKLNELNPRSIFSVSIVFYLPIEDLFTSGKNVKSPYRKKDLGNLEKVIIDCLKDFVMDDDCQIFSESLIKIPSRTYRGMRIDIIEQDLTSYLLPYIHETDKESKDFCKDLARVYKRVEDFKLAESRKS